MCATDRILTRARVRRSAASVCLVTLAAGCALPLLERDSSYPAGWPAIAGPMADCNGISGTFANKGVYFDKAGDKQEIWLTSLLPFPERVPRGDPRHQERAALRSCDRVTLHFERYAWPERPDVKTWRLVVSPARGIAAGAPESSERCEGFHLPIGRGWPLDGSLSAVCGQNAYMLYADPGEIVADSFTLSLARDTDGSLIARWEYGPTWAVDHVWARFVRTR